MKKLLLLTFLTLIFLLPSCKNSSSSDPADEGIFGQTYISKLKITKTNTINVKELCSSSYKPYISYPKGDSNRRIDNDNGEIDIISYFDKGELKPFIFNNKDGNQFVFASKSRDNREFYPIVTQLSSPFIAFRYTDVYKVENNSSTPNNMHLTDISSEWKDWDYAHAALVDMTTGKFYDFSNFSLDNIKYDDNNIYAYGSVNRRGTSLFRIDKNTLKATPLANPRYVELKHDGYHFMVDDDRMIYSLYDYEAPYHYVLFTKSDKHLIPLDPYIDCTKYDKEHPTEEIFGILDGAKRIPVFIRTNDNKLIFAIVKTSYKDNVAKHFLYTAEATLNTDSTIAYFELAKISAPKEISFGLPQDYDIHAFFTNNTLQNDSRQYEEKVMITNQDYFYLSNKKDIYKVTYSNNEMSIEMKTVTKSTINEKNPTIYNAGDNFILVNEDVTNGIIEFFNYTTESFKVIENNTPNSRILYTSLSPENLIYAVQTGQTSTNTYKLSLKNGTVSDPVKYQAKVKDLIRLDF